MWFFFFFFFDIGVPAQLSFLTAAVSSLWPSWNNFHFWSKLHSAKHKHAPVPFPPLLNLFLWLASPVFSVGNIWCHDSSAIFNYPVTSLSPSPKAFCVWMIWQDSVIRYLKGPAFFFCKKLSPANTTIGILHSLVPMVNMSGNDLSVGGRQVWWKHSIQVI